MKRRLQPRTGQALVMVTLALIAMFGIIGLAVDLGWGFYVRRSAQAAADSAALAAAIQVYRNAGNPPYTCNESTVPCKPITDCTALAGTPLYSGCQYAQQNGFTSTAGGSQTVTLQSGVTAPPPTAPGVNIIYYWATARVSERIPQLFSAVLGNTVGASSARATAGVVEQVTIGSLILLNRENDPAFGQGSGFKGGNIVVTSGIGGGSGTIVAPGGIQMSSNASGAGGVYAGMLQGSAKIENTPFTHIRGSGTTNLGGSSSWSMPPTNGYPDGQEFWDPMEGKGQPPLSTASLPDRSALIQSLLSNNGTVQGGDTLAEATHLPPGNYYQVQTTKGGGCNNPPCAQQITLGSGYFVFDAAGSPTNSSFGEYNFFGGLATSSGTNVTFSSGRYGFIGAVEGTDPFLVTNGTTLQDGLAQVQNDCATGNACAPGELFVFTDTQHNYPGLASQIANLSGSNPLFAQVANQYRFGQSGFKTGNNDNSNLTLHGLNHSAGNVPDELKPFSSVLMWQDQKNSVVAYNDAGYVDCGQAPGTRCPTEDLDSPNAGPVDPTSKTPQMNILAAPNVYLYGAVYQPRGAWVSFQGHGSYTGPLQIISGALTMGGSPRVLLTSLSKPVTTLGVALVE